MTCEKCEVEDLLGLKRVILCSDCQKSKQQQTQRTAYLNTKRHKYRVDNQSVETPTKQTETLMTYSQWVIHQRSLLGSITKMQNRNVSEEALKYLGKLCEVCGGSVAKHARLPLCKTHQREHARFMASARKRRQRARVTT